MDKNLKSYIKVYNRQLESNVCDSVVDELKIVNWKPHTFYNYTTDSYYTNTSEPFSYFGSINHYDTLMKTIYNVLHRYVFEDINFKFYSGWNGYSNIKFNKYMEGCSMTEHCDHIHEIFDGEKKGIPVLTVIGLLNDDYQGGELVLLEDETYCLNKGDIIVFPSLFLYPHKVNTVTNGTRYSFTSWAH